MRCKEHGIDAEVSFRSIKILKYKLFSDKFLFPPILILYNSLLIENPMKISILILEAYY